MLNAIWQFCHCLYYCALLIDTVKWGGVWFLASVGTPENGVHRLAQAVGELGSARGLNKTPGNESIMEAKNLRTGKTNMKKTTLSFNVPGGPKKEWPCWWVTSPVQGGFTRWLHTCCSLNHLSGGWDSSGRALKNWSKMVRFWRPSGGCKIQQTPQMLWEYGTNLPLYTHRYHQHLLTSGIS